MDRREAIRRYKETPRPAGVWRVHNTQRDRTLLGTSLDAPAMLNRIRTQLALGAHPNRTLQADWKADGPDAFVLEVLDLLEWPVGGAEYEPDQDLAVLVDLWVERLGITPDRSY